MRTRLGWVAVIAGVVFVLVSVGLASAQAKPIKIGQIIHAVRVAVTGQSIGLGLFDTLAILRKERCLRRIGRTMSQVVGDGN